MEIRGTPRKISGQILKVGGVEVKVKKLSRTNAIRTYCWECSGYSMPEIKRCIIPTCPLYHFRMRGGVPRILTETFHKRNNP